MTRISRVLNETHEGEPQVDHGSPSLENPELIDNINSDFAAACRGIFVSPYKPFLSVQKILTQYHINIPNEPVLLPNEADEIVLPVAQFGDPSNEHVENESYFLYFAYAREDWGFECYAELTDQAGIEFLTNNPEEDERFE